MAFIEKRIEVEFSLSPKVDASGKITEQPLFNGTKSSSVRLAGYRMSAVIIKGGSLSSQGQLQLRIYGMSLELMNQLSTLGKTPIYIEGNTKNAITVYAGDSYGVSAVFTGQIVQAYTDLGNAPDAMFVVDAYSSMFQALLPIPPTSYRGSISAATVLQNLANISGFAGFENGGVKTVLRNPYYAGSALTQIKDCIKETGCEWNQGDLGILAIWPRGGSRGDQVPLISPQTGLIGYPYPSGGGFIGLRTIFNPQIACGTLVKVQSSIAPASNTWKVVNMTHDIECELPGGQWFSSLVCVPTDFDGIAH